MSQHHHEWTVSYYVLLELPTRDGHADRLTMWQCRTCPQFLTLTGHIKVGTPLATPEFWQDMAAQEAGQRTMEAQEARRQQRRKVA